MSSDPKADFEPGTLTDDQTTDDQTADDQTADDQTADDQGVGETTTSPEEAGAAGATPGDESPVADQNEADKLRGEVRDLKDKYLRLMAEFDNFRKRTARERLQERAAAAENTVRSLLPVVDDFDRAKATVDDPANEESFTKGVELVYAKLKRTIESLGVEEMASTGEDFDPDLMEAFSEIPAGPDMAGKVVDTIEPGYFLNDKLIRHAKVVIGK